MAYYFKDRIPDAYQGKNGRFYDLIGLNGSAKVSEVEIKLKNNIKAEFEGDPLNAGNLNFASGNAVFTLAPGQTISKGQLASATSEGLILTNINRTTAASASNYVQNWLKLDDNHVLILNSPSSYSVESVYDTSPHGYDVNTMGGGLRGRIATINWTSKTVSLGGNYTIGQATTGSPYYVSYCEVINPNLICVTSGSRQGANYTDSYGWVYFYAISGETITLSASQRITSMARAYYACSNPVKVGTNAAACLYTNNSDSAYFYIDKFTLNGTTITQTNLQKLASGRAHSGYDWGDNIPSRKIEGLRSYNGGNGEYCILYHTEAGSVPVSDTGVYDMSYNNYLLNSSGSTLNLGVPNPRYDGNKYHFAPLSGSAYGVSGNGIIMQNIHGFETTRNNNFNIITCSTSMTQGTWTTIPANNVTNYQFDSDGNMNLLGASLLNGNTANAFYKGTAMKLYRPFKIFSGAGSYKFWAFESPNVKGEYLFMQYTGGSMSMWFGALSDVSTCNNVAGIALENSANGQVRLQNSGKFLSGLKTGLTVGSSYIAGSNGNLTVSTDTTKAVGIATASNGFIFYGARGI